MKNDDNKWTFSVTSASKMVAYQNSSYIKLWHFFWGST